jgi:hypothetical protein
VTRGDRRYHGRVTNEGPTMFDSYDDACAATVTRAQAIGEIKRHHADPADFLADVGDRPTYRGAEVLGWLGY